MKPFTIFFPQFYATPTNNDAWGQGFTDWNLVANANLNHRWERRAPRRGFYDGASREVHLAQLDEMQKGGIGGVALYHYWFYGRRELAAFEDTLLSSSGENQLPWFLVWATESWSRRWVGDPSVILELPRDPSKEQIELHCEHLTTCFDHPRYFTMEGRPFFAWYNLAHFAEPRRIVESYCEYFAQRGISLATAQFFKNPFDIETSGLTEVNYLFEPRLFFGMSRVGRGKRAKRAFDQLQRVIGEPFSAKLMILIDRFQQKGESHSAEDFLAYLESDTRERLVESIPGVKQEILSPGWNNTPRYQDRFTCLQPLHPHEFGNLVARASMNDHGIPALINAWNEWSEGAAIEPCAYYGTRYLDSLG